MRGIRRIIGISLVMVLMGCNSGVLEEEKSKNKFLQSLVDLGNDFLNVFTSFGDMVSGALGFKAESKKSDVGNYFKNIEDSLTTTKTVLEKIVSDMKDEGNPNAAGVESAVSKFVSETLNKMIDGAKTVSEAIGDASDPIGNVAADNNGGAAGADVDKLVKGIKKIVEVVLKDKGKADAGDDKKASDGSTARTANGGNDEAGKLFSSANAGDAANAKKASADASKAVGAVTGADILKAMVKDNNAVNAVAANAKDATIAGAIALRAMAKDGKFAGPSAAAVEYNTGVKNTVVSAVNKALNTLTMAIRKTVDEGFKTVKESMKLNTASEKPLAISDKK
ncbi:variable large family protein [Borrelia persica]|uniref:variable large family protein n=1 Tax=Borrelia persica TaxID=44448 RepID=UPI000570E623|nr:variable large family protein [Borrelia persica]